MFGRKYNPQEIAEHLRTWIAHGQARDLIGGYFACVRPDELECTRIMFSLHIFPIAASYGIAEAKNDARLIEAVRQAHDLYLSCFRDRDQIVRLGDYVIWRVEREAVASVLREECCQIIGPSTFDEHAIKYGMLLRVVSEIRKRTFATDILLGMSQPTGDSKKELMSACESLGITFTRHVLKIDLSDRGLTSDQFERYQTSRGFAATLLMQGLFTLSDMFKTLRL